jgi:hypothetical protein
MNLTQQQTGTPTSPSSQDGLNTADTQCKNSKPTKADSTKGSGSQSGRGLKQPKQKKCNACRAEFTPTRPMQKVCCGDCAISLGNLKKAKRERTQAAQERKETKVKLEKLKSRSDWAKEAQTAFNRWVRLRDADKPCISCGRHHTGQYHAGHYMSRGARPELAYEPLNCHKQCSPCNTHLSGNLALYRQSLVREIGLQQVEWLEGPHDPKYYSADDLKAIKSKYTAMARELERLNG